MNTLGCSLTVFILLSSYCAICENENLFKSSYVAHFEHVHPYEYHDDLQELFEKFFKKILNLIKQSDPYNFKDIVFNTSSYGLLCQGYLKDPSVSLFSTVNITNLKVTEKPTHFELGINFPQLQVIGNYKLNFDFLTMIPLFGKGDLGAAASNLNASVAMDIGKFNEGDVMQLTALNFNLTIDSLKVDIKNILNNSALGVFISNILSDISPDFLGIISVLVKASENQVKSFINNYLMNKSITFEEIIEIIKQFVR